MEYAQPNCSVFPTPICALTHLQYVTIFSRFGLKFYRNFIHIHDRNHKDLDKEYISDNEFALDFCHEERNCLK